MVRRAIEEVFTEAPSELLEQRTLFGRPLHARALITDLRPGSIELDVLYRVVADLPWAEAEAGARYAIDRGLHCLSEIGGLAGGLVALKHAADWVKGRISQRDPELVPGEAVVKIRHSSTLETQQGAEVSSQQGENIRQRILEEDKATSVGTVVGDPEVPRSILRAPQEDETTPNAGGVILIRDLNLFFNGFAALEEIRQGELFFYNSFAALGLRRPRREDGLYGAVTKSNELALRSVTLSTHEIPDERGVLRGGQIDADDLEDA